MKHPNRPDGLSWQDIVRARAVLASLGEGPLASRAVSLETFCALLCHDFARLRTEGWSWRELSDRLRANGIPITAEALAGHTRGETCAGSAEAASAVTDLVSMRVARRDESLEQAVAVLGKRDIIACLLMLAPELREQRLDDIKKAELRRRLAEGIRRAAGQDTERNDNATQVPAEEGGEHRQQFDIDLGIGGER